MKKKLPTGLEEYQWQAIVSHLNPNTTTINDYCKVLNTLHTCEDGKYNIVTMTPAQAKEYYSLLDEKVNNGILSESTSHRYKSTLRAIATYMEQERSVFPDYKNPFSKLIEKDVRTKTDFISSDFAKYDDIQSFLKVIPTLSLQKQIILKLLIYVGLRPHQISNLTYASFTKGKKSNLLYLHYKEGKYVYKPGSIVLNTHDLEQMKCLQQHKNASITYQVYGMYRFNGEMTRILLEWNPELGTKVSNDPIFVRKNKNPIDTSYIDTLVSKIALQANLDKSAICAKKLCLYGDITSIVMFYHFSQHNQTKENLAKLKTQTSRNQAIQKLRKMENEFAEISSKNELPGVWHQTCPINKRATVKEICNTLGSSFLYTQMGM